MIDVLSTSPWQRHTWLSTGPVCPTSDSHLALVRLWGYAAVSLAQKSIKPRFKCCQGHALGKECPCHGKLVLACSQLASKWSSATCGWLATKWGPESAIWPDFICTILLLLLTVPRALWEILRWYFSAPRIRKCR